MEFLILFWVYKLDFFMVEKYFFHFTWCRSDTVDIKQKRTKGQNNKENNDSIISRLVILATYKITFKLK